MLAYDRGCDWRLVVQDDAILSRDFLPGVEAALAHVPEVPVSFYTGKTRPHATAVTRAVQKARRGRRPFLAMRGPIWGVAVAVPTSLIRDMVDGCDRLVEIANYDLRMCEYFAARGIECWYTLPSLVNHRVGAENPSLVPGRSSALSRVAHAWMDRQSPLDINWSRGPLRVTDRELAVEAPAAPRRLAARQSKIERKPVTVRVRYLEEMARPKGPSIEAGSIGNVPDAAARRLIAKGFAEPVQPDKRRGGRPRKAA